MDVPSYDDAGNARPRIVNQAEINSLLVRNTENSPAEYHSRKQPPCEAKWPKREKHFVTPIKMNDRIVGYRCDRDAVGKSKYWHEKFVCKACHDFGKRSLQQKPVVALWREVKSQGLIKDPKQMKLVEECFRKVLKAIINSEQEINLKAIFHHIRTRVDKIVGKQVIEYAFHAFKKEQIQKKMLHQQSTSGGGGGDEDEDDDDGDDGNKKTKRGPKKLTAAQKRKQQNNTATGKKRKAPASKSTATKERKKTNTSCGKGNKKLTAAERKKLAAEKKRQTAKEKKAAAAALKSKGSGGGNTTSGRGRKSKGDTGVQGGKKKMNNNNNTDNMTEPRPKKPPRPSGYPVNTNNNYNIFQMEQKKKSEKDLRAYAEKLKLKFTSAKVTKTKMIEQIWKMVDTKTKEKYTVKLKKAKEQYAKDLETYKKTHKYQYEDYNTKLEQWKHDVKAWTANKKAPSVLYGGGGGGISSGSSSGMSTSVGKTGKGKKMQSGAKTAKATKTTKTTKPPIGDFLPTFSEGERSTSDDEDILRAFSDGENPECFSINNIEGEEEKLLKEAQPSDETRKVYFELANELDKLPKHWQNLSIIQVNALSTLMENASRKCRAEIGLPVSKTSPSAPYSRMSFAVDHIIRDMLEDLLSLRNHRVACDKTAKKLSSNKKPDDGPLEALRGVNEEDVVPSSSSDSNGGQVITSTPPSSKTKKAPVQLRVVKVPNVKDMPQVFFDQCEVNAKSSVGHARMIEQEVSALPVPNADAADPDSLYELGRNMLKESMMVPVSNGDGGEDAGSRRLYKDEEFQISRHRTTEEKNDEAKSEDVGQTMDVEDGIEEGSGADDSGEEDEKESVDDGAMEVEQDLEEVGEVDDGGISIDDLKLLMARDPRYFSLSRSTSHKLFLNCV